MSTATAAPVDMEHVYSTVADVYAEYPDKSASRDMAEIAFNLLGEYHEELAVRALMEMFGNLRADERPLPQHNVRKGRTHSPRRNLPVKDILKIHWSVGGGVTKPIGEFTKADLIASAAFFKHQIGTLSTRKDQMDELAALLQKHNVLAVRNLPAEEIVRVLTA